MILLLQAENQTPGILIGTRYNSMPFEQPEKLAPADSREPEVLEEIVLVPERPSFSDIHDSEAHEIEVVKEKIQSLAEEQSFVSAKEIDSENRENQFREAWRELKKIEQELHPIVQNIDHANNRQGLSKILTWIDFPLISSWKKSRKKLIKSREPHIEILKGEVEPFSIDATKFFKAIEDSDVFDFYMRLKQNLIKMEELEAAVPGSTKRLSEEYGIFCFARYPKEMLLRQLEQEGDTQTPYGIVLHSRTDWNGSFYGQKALGSLNIKTKDAGLNVRIFECGSLFEVSKQLIKLNRKYGVSQKIQFALVAGHGNEEAIELGKSRLQVDELPEGGLREVASFFVADPTIIMNSCLTAKDDIGISALISEVTGAEVIGSEKKTTDVIFKDIQKVGDEYYFNITFKGHSVDREGRPIIDTIPSRVFSSQKDK